LQDLFERQILALSSAIGVATLSPEDEIMEYVCNENNSDVQHMVGK